MASEMRDGGFDTDQADRYEFVFRATKLAVVSLLCARYGVSAEEMLDALMDSRSLACEAATLMERMEVSPAFVGYVYSGIRF